MRDWLTCLQRLRSIICHLQTGCPRKPVVYFQSKSKGLRTRGASGISPNLSLSPKAWKQESWYLRTGEDWCPGPSREHTSPSSTSGLHSGPQGLEDVHLHWWSPFSFTWSIVSNAILFQKHPHRHIQLSGNHRQAQDEPMMKHLEVGNSKKLSPL